MNTRHSHNALIVAVLLLGAGRGWAFLPPAQKPLVNIDPRSAAGAGAATAEQSAAAVELRSRLPKARVDFDPLTGAPAMVSAIDGLLTGAQGQGPAIASTTLAAIPADEGHRVTRAFLEQHRQLFGYGPEALDQAKVRREFTAAHNGLKTVVWEQQVEGIPVFEAVLISHTTKHGELVNLSSRFVPNVAQAASRGLPNGSALAAPAISAAQAAALAGQNVGEDAQPESMTAVGEPNSGPEQVQKFKAPGLRGETSVKLTWLPVDKNTLRLCWDIILTSRKRGEMFRLLLDVQSGEVRVRHCLTQYISDATYNVFTSDSPSPFSPGYSTPQSTQPGLASRTLVTLPALNTNASPNGWIDDGGNQTVGNNVDAHTDWNDDDSPDLPRPQGSPARVFNFPLDLATQDPTNYSQAAVVSLFYWNNWMHDKLYELGFTEAAGNFQSNNFGRGGLGNDAVQADAQDGGGTDNANFSTPPDGSPGRMQMYVFTGPSPRRDGDLDAEVMLHEYTHGLSSRRVGGGVGISELQTDGMGEGWSDFYALSLLSEPSDNVNGCYACGAYVSYLLGSGFTTSYYFGIRRYPYTTDLTRNPLTFKDIDPAQASAHTGISRSPIIGNAADEVHNMGEVWCVTLWEARANLIAKLGAAAGNQLMLQLVTDGMNLSPANPNFLQARDAILQADLVDTGGTNRTELWAAFAKRGMGASAISPASYATSGLMEAYDLPDALSITPVAALSASGAVGGPFTPNPQFFTLTNSGSSPLTWSLLNTSIWLTVSTTNGALTPGGAAAMVSVSVDASANSLPLGLYPVVIWFTNLADGVAQWRTFSLSVVGRSMYDDFDPDIDPSQWSSFGGTVGSTVLATNFGGSISSPNSLWFGDAGSRFATTRPINTGSGGTISFYLRLANGAGSPWENVDIPAEGVVLEYSTNAGATFAIAGTYDTATYYNWTPVVLPIPTAAQSPSTQFRWRQLSSSGADYDHWALDNVTIDAGPVPPVILTQPVSEIVAAGWTATFSVVASGTSPLSYQWQFNGTNLIGATDNPLTLVNVQSNQAGPYSVVVTNTYGSVTSAPAQLQFAERSSQIAVFADPAYIDLNSGGVGAEGVNVQASLTNLGYVVTTFTNIGAAAATNTLLLFPEQEIQPLAPNLTSVARAALSNFVSQGGLLVVHGGENGAGSLLNTVFGLAVTESTQIGSGPVYSLTAQASETVFAGGPASVPCNNGTSTLTNLPSGSTSIYESAGLSAVALIPFGSGAIVFLGFDWYNAMPIGLQDGGWLTVLGRAVMARPATSPLILTQPASQAVVVGNPATFRVLAAGAAPLSYQWSFNGTNLAGATASALALVNVQLDQAGTYAVQVTNTYGSTNSAAALLTVNGLSPCAPPSLGLVSWWRGESNLLDQAGMNPGTVAGYGSFGYGTGVVGQAFVFDGIHRDRVDVGNPPSLQLQDLTIEAWIKRTSTTDISLDDNNQDGAVAGEGGIVFGYGRAGYGFGVLNNGQLILSRIDLDGILSTGTVADTNWHHVAVSKSGATAVFYIDGVTASAALPYSTTYTFDTSAAIGSRGDARGGTFWGMVDEPAVYARALSGAEILAIYTAQHLGKCDAPTPPVILQQPTNQIAMANDSISFSVLAAGTTPLTYQWRFNGTNLNAATASALALTNIQVSDAGSYSVFLSNSAGTRLSSNAILTVLASPPCAPPPAGLVSWWRAEGNGGDAVGGNPGTLSSGMAFVPGRVGLAFSLNGSNQSVRIPYSPTLITSNYSIEAWVNPLTQVADVVNQDLIFGQNYGAVQLVARPGTSGVRVAFQFGTDKYSFHEVVSTADIPLGQLSHLAGTWDGTTLRLYVNGVLDAQSVPAAVPVDSGCDFFIGGFASAGTGYCDYVGQFFEGIIDEVSFYKRALLLAEVQALYAAASSGKCVVPTPPTIILQPTNHTVLAQSNAVFNVLATGTSPLAYQWRFKGAGLPGETNAALTLTAVVTNQAGGYDAVITNSVGAVTSAVAVLTVDVPPAPVFTLQPASQTARAGTNVTLTALATNSWPLTYQRHLGGAAIPGATNTALSLTDIQAANSGDYTVVAANAWNAATSAVATLTVVPTAPIISLQPQSAGVFAGFAAQLTVAATGTEPFSYQWQLDGTNLPAATNAALALSNMKPVNAGTYRALVANPAGSTNSAEALLALVPVACWGGAPLGLMSLPIALTNAVAISAGAQHNLALRRDGSAVAWGAADQTVLPPGLAGIIAIAAGSDHSVALQADGTVAAWGGANTYGQTNVPVNLSNVVAVAAGSSHSLALKSNGTVVAWGLNTSGQASVPTGLTNVVAISAGSNHCLALRADGKVFAWGNNAYGQTTVPANLAEVVAIAAGAMHSLALRSDGTVAAWGATAYGQTPAPAGLSNVTAIAAGGFHSLAVKSDGTLLAWGAGTNPLAAAYPNLGQAFIPPPVTNIAAVSGGDAHTLALAGDGAPFITASPVNRFSYSGRRVVFRAEATGALPLHYQWQLNNADLPGATNQLLVMDSALSGGSYRVVVTNALGIAASSAAALTLLDSAPFVLSQPVGQSAFLGAQALLQVTVDGSGPFSYQWRLNGTNVAGATDSSLLLNHLQLSQAGNYSVVVTNAFGATSSAKTSVSVWQVAAWGAGTNYSSSPNFGQSIVPTGLNNAVAIAGGGYHTLTFKADGKALAWGAGTNYLTPPNYGQTLVPANLSAVAGVAGGLYHSLALRADGGVAAWGAGTNNTSSPQYGQSIVPAGLTNVVAVAAGDYHSVALKSDGKVAVWGYNGFSLTNVPAAATNVTAIAARGNQVLALRSDGSVVHWGNLATLPPAPYNYVAIAAGVNHCLGLRNDGTVVSWGGAYSVPAGLSNVVDIAAGYDHSVALRNDGTVVTWGATNLYGRNLIPNGLTNVIGIACGSYHSLAVLGDGSPLIKFPPASRAAYFGAQTNFSVLALGAPPLRYQWQCNGADLPGATNATLSLTNLQATDAGSYRVIVTNVFNSTTSAVATLTVLVPIGQAVNAPNLTWSTSGNAAWVGESSVTHDGADAAQSGLITDGQTSTVQTTVTGPGTLNFWWKVSSEEWFDYLSFYIDGVEQAAISGEQGWENPAFAVTNGNHTLRWTYAKDPSVGVGADSAWLDQVTFTTNPPVLTLQPVSQHGTLGVPVTLSVAASGAPPLSYQWLKAGTNLAGATATSLTLPVGTRRDSGVYQVVVSNPGGSTPSSNATLVIRAPQKLGPALRLPGGGLAFTSVDADGGPLLPGDLANFQVQASTNLVDWVAVPNCLTVTNGTLLLVDPDGTARPRRFYRIIELDDATFVTNAPVISLHPIGGTVAMGAGLQLTVAGAGGPPLRYQWLKDGIALAGATTTSLTLSNATRHSSGAYAAVVSNPVGSTPSSNATVVVRVPEKLVKPTRLADGTFTLTASDADGAFLAPGDLPSFEAQVSTNLVNWTTLSNSLSVTNGLLLLRDPATPNSASRFYRIIEP